MKRRKAREYALQFLYRIDFMNTSRGLSNNTDLSWIKDDFGVFWEDISEEDRDIKEFSESIVIGTIKHLKEIDSIIQQVTEKWKFSRIACIDRNILRLATFELLFKKDIPAKVAINEAIEIAKVYSTEESSAFINGILDRIAKEFSHKGINLS